jgi:5'-3' exoribonuclease 2
MGVPSFYRKLINDFPSVYFWKDDFQINTFLIDFNSIIYTTLSRLNLNGSAQDLESIFISEVIKDLQYLTNVLIKDTDLVYIAMDGPPPRAKMVQQRNRRYKSIKEEDYIQQLEKKYQITIPRSKFDKNAISPGTKFMTSLSKEIIKCIKEKKFKTKKVIFSDHLVPGEGEHKLIDYIRTEPIGLSKTLIYSPDADLIILSIILQKKDIYILRKSNDLDPGLISSEYLYLDINKCNQQIEKSFKHGINVLCDYSFMTFLCGNDFVKDIPFLKIKENGMKILIDIYNDIQKDYNDHGISIDLIESGKINFDFFTKLIKGLKDIEVGKLRNMQKHMHRVRNGSQLIDDITKYPGKEPWEIDLLKFQHSEYYSPDNPFFDRYRKVFDKINYFNDNWQESYNNHFFPEKDIKVVIEDFLQSIKFCARYYFNGEVDWSWYYPHRAAPTISSIYDYLINNGSKIFSNSDYCDKVNKPCTAMEQLMMILPPRSFKLLPVKLRTLPDDLKEYYPSDFVLDILQGNKFIYSDPILPDPDQIKIRQFINSHNFNVNLRSKPFTFIN